MQKNLNKTSERNKSNKAIIYQNLISCGNWLHNKEELLGLYFDVKRRYGTYAVRINKMHTEPKKFSCDFLTKETDHFVEIGTIKGDEKICIYTGDGNLNGNIHLFGLVDIAESYSYDVDGNEEYNQDDVYGFMHIANSFDDFFNMAYINGDD
jgi:hypothetical protein